MEFRFKFFSSSQGQESGKVGRFACLARSSVQTAGVRLQLPPHGGAGGRPHLGHGGALVQL